MLKKIIPETFIRQYCNKDKCDYKARSNKLLNYIRITSKKNKPDLIEFLERDKLRKEKKNVKYIKLQYPIIILKNIENENELLWFETISGKSLKQNKQFGNKRFGGTRKR